MTRGIKKAEIEAALAKIGEAKELIDALLTEMEEYFDERSEAWQDGDGGQVYSEKMQSVEMASGYMEEAAEYLNELMDE